jgi:hypothetical protein
MGRRSGGVVHLVEEVLILIELKDDHHGDAATQQDGKGADDSRCRSPCVRRRWVETRMGGEGKL